MGGAVFLLFHVLHVIVSSCHRVMVCVALLLTPSLPSLVARASGCSSSS